MSRSPEASLQLILSSSMCNECEFFGLGSDEEVCVSPSSPVASCRTEMC